MRCFVRPTILAALSLLSSIALCCGSDPNGSRDHDGSTMEKAVVVMETDLDKSVDLQHQYFHQHAPLAEIHDLSIALIEGKKPRTMYQRFEFFLPSGEKKHMWFDMSAAFYADQKKRRHSSGK